MSKLTIFGLSLCLGGLLIIGFQKLSTLMGTFSIGEIKGAITIKKMIEPCNLSWINDISINFIKNATDYIITMPLYIIFLSLGIICLIATSFFKN